MKHLEFISLIACAALLVGCENTKTAGKGSQEAKRLAALQRQAQHQAEVDEAHANLWSAQENMLNRDGSAVRGR